MKILTINHSDSVGPGSRAAHRIHSALRRHGIDSHMWVNHEGSDDWTVEGLASATQKILSRVAPQIAAQVCKWHKTSNPFQRSPAIVPSAWVKRINASDADLVHLHWVQNEMLTIEEIGRITKPLVWTLHDMWAFCGSEHYATDERWRTGYHNSNRPQDDGGWDMNRWAWRRKCKSWRKPFNIIASSQWLADAAKQSALMRDWPVSVIPHTLDTDVWMPIEKSAARKLMSLSDDVPVVAIGAWSIEPPHKGFDLLLSALKLLRERKVELQTLVIGQGAPKEPFAVDCPIHYAGHLHDDLSLRIAYSAADVIVVPSRIESFSETASEAQACGTPVVAFDATGMRDMVEHKSTGYLATAFDVQDLACGIEWVIATTERRSQLSVRARTRAVARYSYPVVSAQLSALYTEVLSH